MTGPARVVFTCWFIPHPRGNTFSVEESCLPERVIDPRDTLQPQGCSSVSPFWQTPLCAPAAALKQPAHEPAQHTPLSRQNLL